MRTTVGMLVTALYLALATVAACGSDLPPVPGAANNDPVPLPGDLEAMLLDSVVTGLDLALGPADSTSPPISAQKALEIAGARLFEVLDGNNVPRQDPSVVDGLIRRRLFQPREALPPTSVWVVVYRWAAGFNCSGPQGGPGPCESTSFYLIDDRTGQVIVDHVSG